MHLSFEEETASFRQAVEAFRKVRLQHTEALQGGHLRNIWQWQGERNAAFSILRVSLDRLVSLLQASDCPDRDVALSGLRKTVAELIEEETVLQQNVEQRRGEAQLGLQKLRSGKRRLLAFRSAASGNARPRFLDSQS